MEIRINDVPQTFERSLSVAELMQRLQKSDRRGIAVAVNDKVISATHWAEHRLQDKDSVLIITASQGG